MWESASLKSHVATSELEKKTGRKCILVTNMPILIMNIQICYYLPVISNTYLKRMCILLMLVPPNVHLETKTPSLRKCNYNILSRLKSSSNSPVTELWILTDESFVTFFSFSVFLLPSGRRQLVILLPHRPRQWWYRLENCANLCSLLDSCFQA